MSHNKRWNSSSCAAIQTMNIRSANTACLNINHYFIWQNQRIRYILVNQMIIFFEYKGFHKFSMYNFSNCE